jgi:hypothetical protein
MPSRSSRRGPSKRSATIDGRPRRAPTSAWEPAPTTTRSAARVTITRVSIQASISRVGSTPRSAITAFSDSTCE